MELKDVKVGQEIEIRGTSRKDMTPIRGKVGVMWEDGLKLFDASIRGETPVPIYTYYVDFETHELLEVLEG